LSTLVGESLEHSSYDLLGTNEDRGTCVDDSVLDLVSSVTEDDSAYLNNPPGFKDYGVVLE
jgi:hypothetical protein